MINEIIRTRTITLGDMRSRCTKGAYEDFHPIINIRSPWDPALQPGLVRDMFMTAEIL
jgi:hypothetical protein